MAIYNSGALITNPATAPSGGLIWTSRNYNGIYKVQLEWLSEELVRPSEYLYIKPYDFRNIRDWTNEGFVKNDKHESDFRAYEYEGIDPATYASTSMNSKFFQGYDFTSVKGAEMAGISIAKSPLYVYIYCNTSNSVPARVTDLVLDLFYQVGGVLRFSMAGMVARILIQNNKKN